MSLVVSKKSKRACIDHIRKYLRKEVVDNKCVLQVTKKNYGFSILCDFFPDVLSTIIIEYAEEVFDINVELNLWTLCRYKITIKNDILKIDYSYNISDINNEIIVWGISVTSLRTIIDSFGHQVPSLFAGFLINRYIETKCLQLIQLNINFDYMKHFTEIADNILSKITDREQFENELIVILELFKKLNHLNLS